MLLQNYSAIMQQMADFKLSWDSLKLLLVAGRSNSLSDVAIKLGMDPTTVSRRMKQLENALNVSLFVRSHGGLKLSDEAKKLVVHVERMETADLSLRACLDQLRAAPQGTVKVSAPPTLSRYALAPALPMLRETAPKVTIDLQVGTSLSKIEKFEVDLAVRIGSIDKAAPNLLATKLGTSQYAVFAPDSAPGTDDWIAYSNELTNIPTAAWVEYKLAGSEPVMRVNDPVTMAAAVAAGAGKALLPTKLGDAFLGIIRQGPIELERDIWSLRYPETAETSIVRLVHEWIADVFRS